MRTASRALASLAAIGLAAAAACGPQKFEDPVTLKGEDLRDPQKCLPCHAEHVREWSGSMHAYAAEDPVFLAMNRRMQRETNGAAGDFCVKCHAPVAVRLGMTKDGLNLTELPSSVKGVTCYFCHSIDAVEGTHDAAVRLADDGKLRGAIAEPAKGMPHAAAYSKLHDREQAESSTMCGACHDIVTPHGAHIERTFLEWQQSLYSKPGQLSCGKCHMDGRDGLAADVPGVGVRRVHDHSFPGVDVALTPFPEVEAQRAAVQRVLDNTLIAKLCIKPAPIGTGVDVTLDNAFAGHKFPSGANQDRRAWVELVGYRGGAVVFESGVLGGDEKKAVATLADPKLWLLRDRIYASDGRETHMFWEAARVESEQLPAAVTSDIRDPAFVHSVTRTYEIPGLLDRVTMRVRMRPMDFDVLDDLVASGDLDPAVRDRLPTFELASTVKEWRSEMGFSCVQ